MAWKIIGNVNTAVEVVTITADTVEDVASVPTTYNCGSVIIVTTGEKYQLNSENQWIKQSVRSGGGGSASIHYEDVVITIGSEQYSGFYYGDANISELVKKYGNVVSICTVLCKNNLFSHGQLIEVDEVRAFCYASNRQTTLRIGFSNI